MKKKITGKKWYNTIPLVEKDFRGRVVLVNFWTSSCVNCIKSFPRLREIWNRFKDKKFLMVGIHAPQFEFEKNPEFVKRTATENDIFWPIVLDNEYKNWKRFRNKYWPTTYLVDKKGEIAYCHIGEGEYAKLEKLIIDLINAKNTKIKFSEMFVEKTINVCFSATPDILCGYTGGSIANAPGYVPNRDAIYKRPSVIPQNKMAINGEFLAASDHIQLQKIGASIYLNFIATEVNLMVDPLGNGAVADVALEGHLFPSEIRGNDVDENGKVYIKEYRTYNILKANFPITGLLSITLKEGRFRVYNFTFSGCVNRCDMPKIVS